MDFETVRSFLKIPGFAALAAVSPGVAIACLPVTIPICCLGFVTLLRASEGRFDSEYGEDSKKETFPVAHFAIGFGVSLVAAPIAPVLEALSWLKEAVADFRTQQHLSSRKTLEVSS